MTSSKGTKVALVGCGPWGKNLALAFAQLGALDAVVDLVPAQATQLAESIARQGFARPSIFHWEEVLKDSHIDAIVLATPASKHAEMVIACLEAGKHVFTEKPFALTVEDGRRIIETAASARNKIVMIGHLFQYHPAFVRLKDMVQKGRLGRIQHIHSRRLNFGRIREEENAFWNLGVHDLSMILAISKRSPDDIKVQAFHHLRPDIADVVSAGLSWLSGLQAHIYVSWMYPQKERKLIVVGDVATAVFDDCEPWESKLRVFNNSIQWINGHPKATKGGCETIALQSQEPLGVECREFLDCIETGRQPVTSPHEAMPVVEVLGRVEAEIRATQFKESRLQQYKKNSPSQSIREEMNRSEGTVARQAEPTSTRHRADKETIELKPIEAIPLIDLTTQRMKIQDEMDARTANVSRHCKFILGPEVRELEERLSEFTGAAHVVTCGSGTDALTLSLLALGLQAGDAVLVPDLSFVATVEPVVLLGGSPIFVDVEQQHLTIDASLVDEGVMAAEKAGLRAVGIIAVDLYGHPANYKALEEGANRHNLWIIGDAAQSFGGSIGERRVGSLARVTTTSFFPSKPLGCYGDGGAIFTDDNEIAQVLRSLRQHGLDETKSNALRIGMNSRLDTIQAAILLCKLNLIAEEREQREKVATEYSKLLQSMVQVPVIHQGVQSAWAAYTIRTKHRDAVKQYLTDCGIANAIYYAIPFHKQVAYRQFPVITRGGSVADHACEHIISLPIGPYLKIATQLRIAEAVCEALS